MKQSSGDGRMKARVYYTMDEVGIALLILISIHLLPAAETFPRSYAAPSGPLPP